MRTDHRKRIIFLFTVCLAIVTVEAQYQVKNQIYGSSTAGSVRYSKTYSNNLLPSESRYQAWKSGALPSEMRMNARAVGPLAPTGARAYIPPSRQPNKPYVPTPSYRLGSVHNAPKMQYSPTPINPALVNPVVPKP